MLKFKFLLWMLTRLLQRAIQNDPACARHVQGKNLVFQIQTRSGAGRHFSVSNGKLTSRAGLAKNPQFTFTFRDAAKGFAILSAKNGTDAFLGALRDGDLVITGDFVQVMWFQGLTEFLQPKKAGQAEHAGYLPM